MPATSTHADSLNVFRTGANADGSAQPSAAASLGNYRSSAEHQSVGFELSSPITGITILYVSAANGLSSVLGDGILTATDSGTLAWTAPGGSIQGTPVAIANGAAVMLEDGTNRSAYIRVQRTSADDLVGTCSVTILDVYNNEIGSDNVYSAEATAGGGEYRALCLQNVSTAAVSSVKVYIATLGTQQVTDATQLGSSGAGSITATGTFADWPTSGFAHIKTAGTTRELIYYTSRTGTTLSIPTAGRALLGTTAAAGTSTDTIDAVPGIQIATEAPSAQPAGNLQTIADEHTAPTGLTWSIGTTPATALSIGTLAAGNIAGLWIHRLVVAGETALPSVLNQLVVTFTAAAVSYTLPLQGRYRVANDALSRYELYLGTNAPPDFTATPFQTFTALPFTTPAFTAAGTYNLVLRRRNRWNLITQNIDAWSFTVDGSGVPTPAPPSDPVEQAADPAAAGKIQVTARYFYSLDGSAQANTFLIYLRSDGTAPDPTVDVPVSVPMILLDGVARLDYLTAAFAEGTTIKVLIRSRAGTSSSDSTGTTILTTTATLLGPTSPTAMIFLGDAAEQMQ